MVQWHEEKHIDLKIQFTGQKKQAMNDPRLNNETSRCNNIAWKKTFHVPGIWNIAGL